MNNDNEQLKKIIIDNWTTIYNTILGREVSLTVNSVQVKNKKDVAQLIRGLQSFIHIAYGELAGQVIVLGVRNKLISIIANLMIGLDSFKDDITDSDREAFIEGISQVFAACQVAVKENLDLDMRFKNITFSESGDPLQDIGGNNVQLWIMTMALPGIAVEKFVLVTPENFAAIPHEEEDHIGKIMLDPVVTPPNPTVPPHNPTVPPPNPAVIPHNPPVSPPNPTVTPPHNPTTKASPTPPPSPNRPHAGGGAGNISNSNLDLLMEVEIPITVRIGSTEMKLIDIMRLGLGSIIELEKMVDEPVEVLANDKLVAKGEIVVCDGNYAVKITEVQSKTARIRSLT